MKLAVLTNFELLGPRQAARFNQLSRALERRDTRLLLLTTNLSPDLEVLYLQIPYALREFQHIGVEDGFVANEDLLISVEEHWIRDFDEPDARRGARACRGFYQRLLDLLEPDFVGPWNTLFPHSRIVQMACEERDIPNFTFERGFLPDTIMLDRLRNNVESELNNSVTLSSIAATYEPDLQLLAGYRSYYADRRPAKYAFGNAETINRQSELLRTIEHPLVLCLSQAHGGGIYPRSSRVARRNYAHFSTLEAALDQLQNSAKGMTVAFRDHPINRIEGRPTRVPSNVVRLDEGPLCEVLPHADIVVSLGSTTAIYEALLLNKPVVVVGDSPIGRFEPYVRCENGDLDTALIRAMDESEHAACQKNADRALSFLLEHFLFKDGNEVPLPRGVEHLADFISSFDGRCPKSLDERFADFDNWING